LIIGPASSTMTKGGLTRRQALNLATVLVPLCTTPNWVQAASGPPGERDLPPRPSDSWPHEGVPDLRLLGGAGDGRTDDTQAVRRWWAASLARGVGYVPRGHYVFDAGEFDLGPNAHTGLRLVGDGPQQSVFMPKGGGMRLVSSVREAFYLRLADIGVEANTDGPALELGKPDFTDELNSSVLDGIVMANVSRSPSAVGLQCNGLYACDLRNVVANCAEAGAAIRLRRAQFCRFQGAAGHAETALHMTEGYNYSNTFAGFDFEEVDRDVVIDSAQSTSNVFMANQYVWRRCAIDATAGRNNVFIAPNFASGGIQKAIAGAKGIIVVGDYGRPGDPTVR
jgi:hypothetical protein